MKEHFEYHSLIPRLSCVHESCIPLCSSKTEFHQSNILKQGFLSSLIIVHSVILKQDLHSHITTYIYKPQWENQISAKPTLQKINSYPKHNRVWLTGALGHSLRLNFIMQSNQYYYIYFKSKCMTKSKKAKKHKPASLLGTVTQTTMLGTVLPLLPSILIVRTLLAGDSPPNLDLWKPHKTKK